MVFKDSVQDGMMLISNSYSTGNMDEDENAKHQHEQHLNNLKPNLPSDPMKLKLNIDVNSNANFHDRSKFPMSTNHRISPTRKYSYTMEDTLKDYREGVAGSKMSMANNRMMEGGSRCDSGHERYSISK